MEFENILQFPGILQNWVNEANMSQLAQEKQVNLGTSADSMHWVNMYYEFLSV